MKIKLLTIVFLLISNSIFAQDALLESEATAYIKAMEAKDFDQVIDKIYPPLFDYITIDQFRSVLEMMDNPTVNTEFSNMELASISQPYFSGSGKYVMIEYKALILLNLKGDLWSDEMIQITMQTMQAEYGEVSYDPMARSLQSNGLIHLLGINDPNTGGTWKFVENSKSLGEILNKIIPADVFGYFDHEH